MTKKFRPLVQVVIAIHRYERPIERAVASVVEGNTTNGAIVVVHNIDPEPIRQRLEQFGSRVQILTCTDGIPSPAGPLNTGLEAATAPYVTAMGSDDYYQSGAGKAWAKYLKTNPSVDILILPTLEAASGTLDLPPVRVGRRRRLDPVKDRLTYRTGPLMLVRTELLKRYQIRMSSGLRTGEDLAYSSRLFMVAQRIDLLPASAPKYIEADDGGVRVTSTPFTIEQQCAGAAIVANSTWAEQLKPAARQALAVRLVRKSILPAVAKHSHDLSLEDIDYLYTLLTRVLLLAPRYYQVLSRNEARLVDALIIAHGDGASPDARQTRRLGARQAAANLNQGGPANTVAPVSARGWFSRQSRVAHWSARKLNQLLDTLNRGDK